MEKQVNFYYLKPNSIPQVVFSHVYTTQNYDISLGKKENFIEFTYFETGFTHITYPDGELLTLPAHSIFVNFYDTPLKFSSNGTHTHYTVAIKLESERLLENPNDKSCFRLNKTATDEKFVQAVAEIIKKCVKLVLQPNKSSLELSALVLQIFALYQKNELLLLLSEKEGPLILKYVHDAEKYILNHVTENFTVQDVADELCISSGYLSNIFRKITGTTIIKYKNNLRLEIIKNLVCNESSTLAEACNSCGISDPNYVSRMFRKYTDSTLTQIKNESKSRR